ncbi:MAG: OB-fold domain-containing protein [Dehalococcoidia bacterium]|nr:OB-fold domain-containing protein [Dehalococcoidia bacterium]
MVGIISYGAYIPLYRLSREAIAKAWGTRALPGEKAICNYDEDTVTMAVAAGIDCLNGFDPKQVDGLFLATTTSPYREKQAATIVASALDLPREARTANFSDSLRGATIALLAAMDAVKSGSARSILVVASDTRMGAAQGEFEQVFGDGAAAVLVGSNNVIAEMQGSYSIFNEFFDVWRTTEDVFVRSGEDRFIIMEGYTATVQEAVAGLLKKYNLSPKSFAKVAIYAPDMRSQPAVVKALGFDAKTQVQDTLFASIGHSGTASVLMMLAAALEGAKSGEKILAASYGDGSDALMFGVTPDIAKVAPRRGVKGYLSSKKVVDSYEKYVRWRGLMVLEPQRRPRGSTPSLPAIARQKRRIFGFWGVKCQSCGTVQYPPQRICVACGSKDKFDEHKLADKKGKVVTFTKDNLYAAADPPTPFAAVDFEGGGRFVGEVTDKDAVEIDIGMPVEMSFRKVLSRDGIHDYFWKFRAIR